jgi:hypothetical protein
MCKIQGISLAKGTQVNAAQEVQNGMASKLMILKIRIKPSQAFVNWFSIFLRNLKKRNVKSHI